MANLTRCAEPWSPPPEGPRKLVEPSRRPSCIACYANPHSGKTLIATVGRAVNTPDPRNTPLN